MRFVDTQNVSLVEIPDSDVNTLPKGYAILSHRWLDEEVTFDDFESRNYINDSKGSIKLQNACALACSLGFDLIWIDTCCIDKRSSTELSETINSMYRWYSDAEVCLAYLPDVLHAKDIGTSEWFNRGWTLQELIAPKHVSFYSTNWEYLGSKHDLTSTLSAVTKIPKDVLAGVVRPQTCSVAQRMSWAASRTTTRVEDMAYSLLGLFNVSMTMIYGEREQAFVRLQEEIIKKSADQSIFAWNLDQFQRSSGLLAPSVSAFRDCDDVTATNLSRGFSFNNTGLSIQLPTRPYSLEVYLVALEAIRKGSFRVCILLARLPEDGQYVRTCAADGSGLLPAKPDASWASREIHVRQDPKGEPAAIYQGFWLRQLQSPTYAAYKPVILSRGVATHSSRIQFPPGRFGTAGVVWMASDSDKDFRADKVPWYHVRWLAFGFDRDFNPICLVSRCGEYARCRGPRYSGFQRALDLPAGSVERSENDVFDGSWMTTKGTAPKLGRGWQAGFVVLKGDRQKGLSSYLSVINLNIEIKRCPDHGMLMEDSTLVSPVQEVWTVDIVATGNKHPEWSHRKASCDVCCDDCAETC